jgi:biopolymer transport protein ExbB/TolQ
MEISSGIMTALYMVSTSLLYPVIIALLGLIAYSLMLVGSFLSEYASRSRDLRKIREGCKLAREYMIKEEYSQSSEVLRSCGSNEFVTRFIDNLSASLKEGRFKIEAEKLLQDYEIKMEREVEKSKLIVRIGPMLGLMGTLIPMGPALMGLSAGNIQQLASNLIIAFSTTVLGLMVGGIGYAITTIKRRWYAQDLSDMEYIVELLGEDK